MSDSFLSSHECPSPPPPAPTEKSTDYPPCKCTSSFSIPESVSSGFSFPPQTQHKKVDYKNAKSVLLQPSSITGETLFDHLVEIIKRIIDERPVNVIDYFEQFSRDVREHKFRVAERLCVDPYNEPQFLEIAEAVLKSLKLPYAFTDIEYIDENEYVAESVTLFQSSESSLPKIFRDLSRDENTLQLQHFWWFCGMGFQIDEMFQLSWVIQKVQFHHSIASARFWGRIYGLRRSYYIVEATLTPAEIRHRLDTMRANLLGRMVAFIKKREKAKFPTETDLNLVPGLDWLNCPKEDLDKMTPEARPPPFLLFDEKFDMPAEFIGTGLNRKTYYVLTSLRGEWHELPIVTPKQIEVSKKIKKFFTGNLEASLSCYPVFPGTEKNYLRAMIARITAGTYIAPHNYYRRMTRRERKLAEGELMADGVEEELEEEEYEEEGEDMFQNDDLITENLDYVPYSPEELQLPNHWVHVRPHILNQGRVVYIDEELAIKDLERRAILKIKKAEREHLVVDDGYEGEGVEEVSENEQEDLEEEGGEEEMGEEEERPEPETGPELFSLCSYDTNTEDIPCWTSRYSSVHNKTNQMVVMRSNLWPGAYSFAFEKECDCLYLGWGTKYVPRGISLQSVPQILNIDYPDSAKEAPDPTVEMEEKWRLYHLKKDMSAMEEMSNISVEFDVDDEGDAN